MATNPLETAEEPAEGGAMDESELASLLKQFAAQAIGEEWDEVSAEQETAINYYYRRMPDLAVDEGSSSVVSDTVQTTVDDAMAEVLKPFVSSSNYVEFKPQGPEDEEQAEQATDYVNYTLHRDNPGFLIFHNWFKDALLTKLGIVKVYWEDKSKVVPQQVQMDPMQLLEARQAPEYGGEVANIDGTYTVTMNVMQEDGRVCVENIPPEEYLIAPFSRSSETAIYQAHRPKNKTRSDLIEWGFDPEIVDDLPAWTGGGSETGRETARYQDERYNSSDRGMGQPHKSQDIIGIIDEYVRIDFDGDGIAELRRVVRVGNVILLNEEVDEPPFALLCPIPMPHKVYGLSLADQTTDLQRIETALWRQMLDNLYKSNNPRPVLPEGSERVDGSTLDSLNDNAPGAAIMEGRNPLRFEAVPFTAAETFPMMAFMEQKRASRTGFNSLGQGLDRDSLNTGNQITATQASQMEDKSNARAELISRIFAETGVTRLMKLVLACLVKYQPKARMIKLRNEWVEIDPSGWNPDMDMEVNVGLGIGNEREQIAQADSVLMTMAELVQSPFPELVSAENTYKAVHRKYTAAGIKNADDYITKPPTDEQGNPVPKEPQPDPEMVKIQGEQQLQQAKLEGQQAEAALKIQLAQQDAATKQQLAREQAEFEASLAQQKAQAEFALAEQRLAQEMQLAERRMQMEERMADHKASIAEKSALSKNRPGGDLDK